MTTDDSNVGEYQIRVKKKVTACPKFYKKGGHNCSQDIKAHTRNKKRLTQKALVNTTT